MTGEKLSSKQTGGQAIRRPQVPTKAEKIGARKRKHFIALPCETCEELCPSDKLIDHQLQCRKERENAKQSQLKDTSFQAQEFAFN